MLPGEGGHRIWGQQRRFGGDRDGVKAGVTVAITGLPADLVPFGRDRRWTCGWGHPEMELGDAGVLLPGLLLPSAILLSPCSPRASSGQRGQGHIPAGDLDSPVAPSGLHSPPNQILSPRYQHPAHGTTCPQCPSGMIPRTGFTPRSSSWPSALVGGQHSEGLCPLLPLIPQLQGKGQCEYGGEWTAARLVPPPPLPAGCWLLRVASPQPLFREDKARA